MSGPTVEVADILHAQGDRFVEKNRSWLGIQRLSVLRAITRCRTAALGGHIDHCPRCGHQAISYNSCRNRHCPKCQAQARQRWLAAREREVLGVPYFHGVFTIPPELNPLCQYNPEVLYGLLFQASAATLLEIAADPKHMGAEIGFLSILHTWGQNLLLHPHVHCAIPAGGFSPDHTRWIHPRYPFFLPVKVLSRVFDQSHFFLLSGRASFHLPAGHYRVEAYKGLFFIPASQEFDLRAGETQSISLKLKSWAAGAEKEWISSDDHIHLTRSRQDDEVFLRWLEAEDLSVGNFLQLQRQMDAAVQYAFGRQGEARRKDYSIRPGHESRSEFYGHVNLLGGREIIRPLSVGSMYANTPEAYPYPAVLFAKGRSLGATVGYAHFNGSMPHSTLLMDLALGNIDFLEVFQFGILKTEQWYELLNAGLHATGIAGSDFPVPLNRVKTWPRWLPLLGPERTLVKARGNGNVYDSWAAGVRKGDVIVSNGPLVEIMVTPSSSTATASASFFRPLEKLEIVSNGRVVATVSGDGKQTRLNVSTRLPETESCWIAARTVARKEEGEPDIQAHTNPTYLPRAGKPVMIRSDRETVAARWESEIAWYKSAPLVFYSDAERREFFDQAERALAELRRPLSAN